MTTKIPRFIILGGGISGTAVWNFFQNLGMSAEAILVDKNHGIKDSLENAQEYLLDRHSQQLIKSPGIPPQHPWIQIAKEKGITILSELDFGLQYAKGTILGITGTDGKSTTTALTHHLLQHSLPHLTIEIGGNIGKAFTSFCNQNWDVAVLELSSYQLEDSQEGPCRIAAILNLAPDHLDRHGTMENYAKAKSKIISKNNPNSLLVTNARSFYYFQPHLQDFTGQIHMFHSLVEDKNPLEKDSRITKIATISIKENWIQTNQFTYRTDKFPLSGFHNLENLAASLLLCEAYGSSCHKLQEALETFPGLPHRFERFLKVGEWEFINDSKSTNLHSLLSWLKNFPFHEKSLHLIMGGRPKGESLDEFFKFVFNKPLFIYVYGEAATIWKKDFLSHKVKAYFCNTIKESLIQIQAHYKKNKNSPTVVVLSPACSSFDQYTNFEERGDVFKDDIKQFFLEKE